MKVPAEAFSSLSIEVMTRERMKVGATVSLLRIAVFLLQHLVLGAVTNGLSNGCGWCLSATGLLCNLFSFLLFVAILSEREQYDYGKGLSHTGWC